MKKMRLPLLIALGVMVVGIILGSFFDLAISQALVSDKKTFALTVSAIAPTFGFGVVAMMGGGFIAFFLNKEYHKWQRILFIVLAVACYGVSVYYAGNEYFNINGFYKVAPVWVGFLIVIIPEGLAMYGGYLFFKHNENKNMWIILCIMVITLVIALLGAVTGLKAIMHRPRYRFIISADNVPYYNWWEPCKEYKELIARYQTDKDNFKSFPSGHTAETAILFMGITFFPLANKKYGAYQIACFVLASMFFVALMVSRILVGAHFLSDVSWGGFIMIGLTEVSNEIVIHKKELQLEEVAI